MCANAFVSKSNLWQHTAGVHVHKDRREGNQDGTEKNVKLDISYVEGKEDDKSTNDFQQLLADIIYAQNI